jgi:hypothetical protein
MLGVGCCVIFLAASPFPASWLYCLSSCTLLPPPPPSPPNWVCINSTDQLQLLLLLPCNYWAVVVCTKAC